MTEFNMFCWSERYNDDDSFQQKRFRIFNNVYERDVYIDIVWQIKNIITDAKSITHDEIKQIMAIEGLVFDEFGFEFITGIKVQRELTEVEKAIALLTEKGVIVDDKIIKL